MARTKRVVLALGHTREATNAAHLAIRREKIATLRDDLMRICLMAYIPHQLIVRCVVDIVQSNGQLNRTEARCQVARVFRALLDNVLAQLATILRQLLKTQVLQVGG